MKEYYYVSLVPEHEFLLYPNLGIGTNYALTLTTGAGFMKAFVSNVIGTADDEIVKINNIVENGNDVVSVSIYDQEYLSGSLPIKKTIKYISGKALFEKKIRTVFVRKYSYLVILMGMEKMKFLQYR